MWTTNDPHATNSERAGGSQDRRSHSRTTGRVVRASNRRQLRAETTVFPAQCSRFQVSYHLPRKFSDHILKANIQTKSDVYQIWSNILIKAAMFVLFQHFAMKLIAVYNKRGRFICFNFYKIHYSKHDSSSSSSSNLLVNIHKIYKRKEIFNTYKSSWKLKSFFVSLFCFLRMLPLSFYIQIKYWGNIIKKKRMLRRTTFDGQ